MNIHPLPTRSPLAPEDWTMNLSVVSIGSTSGWLCEISRSNAEMCRLSVIRPGGCNEFTRLDAAEKTRAWICEFLGRSPGVEAVPAGT